MKHNIYSQITGEQIDKIMRQWAEIKTALRPIGNFEIYQELVKIRTLLQNGGNGGKKMKKTLVKYCLLCGNRLDPKIHIKDFGKTPEELADLQKEFLIEAMKALYIEGHPEFDWVGESLVKMLENEQ